MKLPRASSGVKRSTIRTATVVFSLSATCTASTFLGWTKSGSRVRDSYETLRAAQRLGLDELAPFRVVWFLVPVLSLLVGVVLISRLARRIPLAAVLTALQVGMVAAVGAIALASPIRVGAGPILALVVAGIAVSYACVATLFHIRRPIGDRTRVT